MKIVADANIIEIESSFRELGELVLIPGRKISNADLVDADALLVRSVTRVDRSLLDGTAVRFIATASSGVDHIDLDYLADKGIGFADAKGSNANAVVDYCFAALAFALLKQKIALAELEVGIIGGGAVGGLFANKLTELGIAHRVYDPFLVVRGRHCRTLDEAMQCKVVSLHVPLTQVGAHPTASLVGAKQLELLPADSVLINTCRGAVVDEHALAELLTERADITTVFDVWENEPDIDVSLALRVDIATPHIAGYSQPAKVAATECILRGFQRYFSPIEPGRDTVTTAAGKTPPTPVGWRQGSELPQWATLLDVLPLSKISQEFKQSLARGAGISAFDEFRNSQRQRLEFKNYSIEREQWDSSSLKLFAAMGFELV